jgi:hypothetical protein
VLLSSALPASGLSSLTLLAFSNSRSHVRMCLLACLWLS